MSGSNSYQRIWKQAALIPPGQVASYGQIARLAGLPPRAARMVGRALGAAPRELELPWHRVVNAQGKISFPPDSSAYRRQKDLLEQEGVMFLKGKIDLSRYGYRGALDNLLWGEPM